MDCENRIGHPAHRRERFARDTQGAKIQAISAELRRDEQSAQPQPGALTESVATCSVDIPGFGARGDRPERSEVLEPRLQRPVTFVEKWEM